MDAWLWSDLFFISLLIIIFAYVLYSLKNENHRLAIQRFFDRPIAMIASVILSFFLVIGTLDSIPVHIKTEHYVTHSTLLDHYLFPLGSQDEKTYSAPFALNLYSSETIWIKDTAHQIYPRLKYPPDRFKNTQEVRGYCLKILMKIGLICFLGALISIFFNKKSMAFWLTLWLMFFITCSAYILSREFHILGTGKIGQDIFYYAIKSIRTGLVIGTLTTLFMMPLALMFGVIAGYFGGWLDDVVQYIYTTLSSIPGVLLITASVLSMQTFIANHPKQFTTLAKSADARLLALCFILGITSWTNLCRLIRAEILKLREIDFVLAAKALGTSALKIIIKHLLPNVMHLVIITLVLDFSFLILAEAVLAYVGVGVSPMTISWGNMINAARLELSREPVVWWPMVAAFLFMFTLVIASNIFADEVRDAFDPRQEH